MDSDSDDWNLYTKTEENFGKALEENKKMKVTMFEHIRMGLQVDPDVAETLPTAIGNVDHQVNLTPEDSGTRSNYLKGSEKSLWSVDTISLSPDISPDFDEELPLSEWVKKMKTRSRPSSKPRKSGRVSKTRRTKRNRQRNDKAPSDVICFDDDEGYEVNDTITQPINFNTNNRNKNRLTAVSKENTSTISLESDEDDFDDEITILINWKDGKNTSQKQFKLHRYENFVKVYENIAQSEGVSVSNVLLFNRDFTSIRPTDTLSSLNVGLYVTLSGYLTSNMVDHNLAKVDISLKDKLQNNCDNISVKLLVDNKKHIMCSIGMSQKMDYLFKKCCEEFQCDKNKIKITFDGESIVPDDLPSSLHLEDGDVFDVFILNK